VLNSTKRSSVLNVHVAGESSKIGDTAQISLPHTLAPGPVKNEDYGLELSQRFLPNRVVKNAEQICKFLRDRGFSKAVGPATRGVKQNKLILALPDLLKQATGSTMDDSAMSSYMNKLQTEFTIRMNIEEDDATFEEQPADKGKQVANPPALEKPAVGDMADWKNKCDASEQRVMSANAEQSLERKRPASGGETSESQKKRSRAYTFVQSTRSQATPISRGSMLEELRKAARTPIARPARPTSVAVDSHDSETGWAAEDVPAREKFTVQAVIRSDSQRAVSISSDSSSYDADTSDNEDDDLTPIATARASAEASPEPTQPLAAFQPLAGWYAGVDQTQRASGEEAAEASASASVAETNTAASQIPQEFVDEDEQ
jgi:DNA mismatch repair protein MSH4